MSDYRDTLGFEVVVRFYPGAEREAFGFYRSINLPEQAQSVRVDRIVTPAGEERVQTSTRVRSRSACTAGDS